MIAEAATVLSLIVAVFAWWFPRGEDDRKPSRSTALTQVAASTGAPAGSVPPSTTNSKSLLETAPDRGADKVEKSGSALAVACGSGSSGDRVREIAYPLYGSYAEFTGELVAAGSAPRETRIQLEVFADQNRVANTIAAIGARMPIRAPISKAQTLTLRVTCESPDGIARLERPTLH